jgi:hypothetical protein
MAFDYEAAKSQYGAQRAQEMAREAATQFPAAPTSAPAAPAPAPAPAGAAPAPKPAGAAPSPLGDLSGFKSYADWQAANRAAGGSGVNGMVAAALGAGPGTAAIPGQTSAGGGTAEQRQTAQMASGSFADDSPDAGKANTGDPYLDELRSGRVAGSEDWRRFSNAQLKAWEPYYAGNGKFRNKYGDIVDKPDDVGPNTPPGFNGTGDRIGGGGGGAGGGGSSSSSTTASSSPAGGDFANLLQKNLEAMLRGGESRYNPQAVQGLLAAIKQRVESSKSTQQRQAAEEAAGRGMSRSGRTGTNLAAIGRGAEAQFTGEYANVLKNKIDADYQDKVAAIDRSQKYLDSLRDELYRRDMSAIQRQQFQANLDLAYANIRAQREALDSNQQYGKDMLAAQYGYGATFGG